jgi:hypothetical protein
VPTLTASVGVVVFCYTALIFFNTAFTLEAEILFPVISVKATLRLNIEDSFSLE